MRFTRYTFGGMDSWMVLALAVGVISAMDILTTIDTCDYLWINLFVLDISVGIGFYDLLIWQVEWLSLWMTFMYVWWQWHNRRWDHSCLRCWILWIFCGYQDGAHGVLWSMMVDVLGGIILLSFYVATDWPYVMHTTCGRFLR